MKKPSRLEYAYAVGRVRVLERKLVERAVFSEAAEEKDFPSAVKILFDVGDFPEEMVEINDADRLEDFIGKEGQKLLKVMSEILLEKEIMDVFQEERNPEKALVTARNTGYSFIIDYFRHKIDLANLKVFCRLKYLNAPSKKFEELVLRGGFLDVKTLIQSYEASYAETGEKIQATFYSSLWDQGIDTLEEEETFVELERGIEDFLMEYLRKAKYVVFGPEPVFAYGLAKKHELNLIRLLGVGKLANIPAEILKQRISQTYV